MQSVWTSFFRLPERDRRPRALRSPQNRRHQPIAVGARPKPPGLAQSRRRSPTVAGTSPRPPAPAHGRRHQPTAAEMQQKSQNMPRICDFGCISGTDAALERHDAASPDEKWPPEPQARQMHRRMWITANPAVENSAAACGKLRTCRAPARHIQPPAELHAPLHHAPPARSVFGLKSGRIVHPLPALRLRQLNASAGEHRPGADANVD